MIHINDNTMSIRKIAFSALLCICCLSGHAQDGPWFVDGFHGGVYGHYPLDTYTKYMSDLLEKHPDWAMCLEIEPETWDTVKVVTPDEYLRFRRTVKDGRVEYTNPSYAQPYLYNISGESIIRQFHYGIRKLREHFPEMTFDTYAVEEPCFTSCLPQVLKGFGFKYASLKNPNTCWGGYYDTVEGEIVNWIAPDGSSVLCSPRHTFEALSDENVFSTLANNNCAEYLAGAASNGFKHPVGMTYQDAGWTFGPWLESQWKDFGDIQPVGSTYTTWRNFFGNIASDVTPVDYVSDQEDVLGALMWGTQVMQEIGKSVRKAENDIVRAEKTGVMANIAGGYRYSETLVDEAWRTLLLSQHHDSWIVPYNNLKAGRTWADWICDTWTVSTCKAASKVLREAENSLVSDREAWKDNDAPFLIRVFNTAGKARRETVSVNVPDALTGRELTLRDAGGRTVASETAMVDGEARIIFTADVPSFGYATYSIAAGAEKKTAARTPRNSNVIENDMYRIVFDRKRGGTIRSIVCKKDGGKELVKKGEYAFGELKGFFYDENRFISSADAEAVITVVEDNRFEKKIRVAGMLGPHPFVQTVTLREGDPKIDFDLKIDWQGNPGIGAYRQRDAFANPERSFYDDRYHLNMYFPAAIGSPELYKGAPFDVVKSKLDDTNFTNWHNLKHNILLDWVSLEGTKGGMALLSDHTTSYVYGGGRPLALTVQSSGNGLWGRDYVIDGPTELHFSIVPHNGGWRDAVDNYNDWNEPLQAYCAKGLETENVSFADAGGYEIAAAYMDGDDVIVRLFNHTGDSPAHKVMVSKSFRNAEEIDLSGNTVGTVRLQDGCFETSMPYLGFKTFRLSR